MKKRILGILAFVLAFEWIGLCVAGMMYPSIAALVVVVVSAIPTVLVWDKWATTPGWQDWEFGLWKG